MFEMNEYKTYMDQIQAPERLYREVLKLKENKIIRRRAIPGRRIIIAAAALALLFALSVAAGAVSPFIFGWGGNFVVSTSGESVEGMMNIGSSTEPVIFEDGRMIFIVNNEYIDITDKVSESQAFMYEFTDEEGIIHYWMVGKNGPEMDNYGFGEFLYRGDGSWAGGYGSNHIGADGEQAQWFVRGKADINAPW